MKLSAFALLFALVFNSSVSKAASMVEYALTWWPIHLLESDDNDDSKNESTDDSASTDAANKQSEQI